MPSDPLGRPSGVDRRQPGRVVVLGAGPTGLGAAMAMREQGHHDFVVLEAAAGAGGLAASERDPAGFTWDLGGHVQFSHYETYDRVLDRALGDGWHYHERRASIRVLGRDVAYPFQHHLDELPAAEREWAAATLAAATRQPTDDSFAAWLLATFGEGICNLFLTPYNEKVWQHPLHEMSASWMGERVARPRGDGGNHGGGHGDGDGKGQRGGGQRGWGPNASFRYPAHGGTGAIWRAVAALVPACHLRFGARVVSVDTQARVVELDSGDTFSYDTLVTTLPLDELPRLATPLSVCTREAAGQLVANTVELVGIGVDAPPSPDLRRRTWMYFPDPARPYYRVTVLSNYAASNAPDADSYSLLTESSHPRGHAIDVEALVSATHRALAADGLIPPGTPLRSTWQRTLPRGYPVPTRGRDTALSVMHAELEPLGIYSRGRFGGWKYEVSNQDHSYMQGVELVHRLLHGAPETTYPHPDLANAQYHRA